MQSTPITLSTAIVLSFTALAAGQDRAANREGPAPVVVESAVVDVTKLPIDFSRIQRRLRTEAARQAQEGLNLRFFVDVYAPAPPIVLFTPEDNLQMGPVPYGGPTHREVIQHITPKEHSAPAADFGALFRWVGERAKK